MDKLISILVPIYNVESSIKTCLLSLFNQTYKNIEYVFVNDCTPDNSIQLLNDILDKFPERKHQVKLIEHKTNKGLGHARRTAFENSTGDYLIHIDSDDWCELSMIEEMVNAITSKNEDIIICDYFVNYSKTELIMRDIEVSDKNDLFRKIIRDEVFPSLCNKLISRKCYLNIEFPEFSLGEDYYILTQLVNNAKHISKVDLPLFHYNQQNEMSITTKKNENLVKDIKQYCYSVKNLLIKWNIFKKFESDYYTGVLSRSLVMTNGYKTKEALLEIEPKAINLLYLWSLDNRNIPKKIVYSLSFLGLGGVVRQVKKLNLYARAHKLR